MTRKQFEELDYFQDTLESIDVDSIVLLPTKRHYPSGYNIFFVIACNKNKPVGIDCLRGSGLMRIFLPTNEYVVKPYMHQIVKKEIKE